MTFRDLFKAAVFAWFLSFRVFADDPSVPEIRRSSFGVRFEDYTTHLFAISDTAASTAKPLADYSYTASSNSPRIAIGPTLEYRLSDRISLVGEFHFHHAVYVQTTQIRNGKPDPIASSDNRPVTTITESSKVNYWEIPIMLHYYRIHHDSGQKPVAQSYVVDDESHLKKKLLYPIREARPAIRGMLSRSYLAGGLEYRYAGKVRTGTEYSYADKTTDYNEVPARLSQRSQVGFVVGAGVRLHDDYVKVMPEIRFVHWQGVTLQGPAFRSAANQLEVGIGFSY